MRKGARLFPILIACFACAGCGGSTASSAPTTPNPEKQGERRPETIASEGCSESGRRVELLDTNGDQKPDIRKVFDKASGKELCRVSDLNHDGKPDLIEYFDDGGNVRRREYCYDNDGLVNAIEYFEGGKLVRREYDTTHRHKIDTWDWFDATAPLDAKTGRPVHPTHRERDTGGFGRIDEWWTWDGDKVTIAVDSNGDGKPDPASAVVLGGSHDNQGQAPAPAPPPAPAPSGSSADAGPGPAAASTPALGNDGGAK